MGYGYLPPGSSSAGAGTSFDLITAGTNANALVVSGSLAATGGGTIAATSVPASGLTGTTLAGTVTASSLTSVGTLTALVLAGALTGGTTAAFSTSVTCPLLIGGSGTTQTLTYKTTTGVGATGADHVFLVGNNGATTAMKIQNDGKVIVGTASIASGPLIGLNVGASATVSWLASSNGTQTMFTGVDSGQAAVIFGSLTSTTILFKMANVEAMRIDTTKFVGVNTSTTLGTFHVTQTGYSGAATTKPGFYYSGTAHPNIANSETIDVYFNIGRTITFAGNGATISTQRAIYIEGVTYAAIAAQTIGTAAVMAITAAASAGTNVTIANPLALWVQSGASAFVGNLIVGAVTAGATAVGVLALSNAATAPSTSVDLAHLYSADCAGAGTAALACWAEDAERTAIAVTSTNSIPFVYRGTTYYLLCTTVRS